MTRTAKLIRWFNKNDITLYYRGHKVFRGNLTQVLNFEKGWSEKDQELTVRSDDRKDSGLTKSEAWVLRAIATNCYNELNYGIPTTYEECRNPIWSECINDATYPSLVEGKALSGVCGSLSRKGFVTADGKGDDASIAMTKTGFEAMMKYFGGNLATV